MKRILILAILLMASPSFAAQQQVGPATSPTSGKWTISDVITNRINPHLAAADANFDELYAFRPWVIQSTAPADTTLLWFDDDQESGFLVLKVHDGSTWVQQAVGEGGSYTLPVATASVLGGVKQGTGVTIAGDGTISASSLVGDCTAEPCLDGSSDGGNLIKLYAGTGSYWTALQGGAPAANRSWRLPIAAPPAAGETLVMTMDQYGQMGFLAAPETSGYVLSSTDAGVLSWAAGGSGAGDDLGDAAYSDVVALWTTCTGYLKSDGTCDTPSGSMTYPGAGVANSTGSAWGPSYTVGTAANNLVQLNASAQLPAVSAALLTNFPTLNQNTTGTAAGLTAQYIDWNASSGGASIANKPTLGTAASLNVGTGANNIVQLNSSGELPFTIDLSDLTDTTDILAGKQAADADLTTWAGVTPGTGVATALAVNVGSAGAPVLFNGAGGTPSSLTLTNATGLPASSVGNGFYVADDCTAVSNPATGAICFEY